MEWDLLFSPIGCPFHPGIPKTQTFPNHVYINAIRVPWGVSDEFKANNEIAAGFQSALFGWSTINKNVDWINYIITRDFSIILGM
jgi:hypothetical protein